MDQSAGSGNGSGNPLKEMYDEWSNRTPVVTRNSLISIIFIYILSFFLSADALFATIPYFVLYHFEIYRILLASIVGNSIISLLMICLFYPAMGTRLETSLGSAGYLSLLGIFGLLVNVTFLILCFLLSFLGVPEALFWECSGFWTILFGLIVVECMQMPDVPRRILCIPVDIPSKYFPLVLYLFFSLMSGPDLSYALGMGIGYLYVNGRLDAVKPSIQRLQHMETAGFLSSVSRSSGWIPVGSALGVSVYVGDGPSSRDVEAGNQDRNSSGAGTVWRTGGQSQVQPSAAMGPTTSQTMHPQEVFPGSGRTLANSGGGGVMNALWSSQTTAESKSDRAEMAARRLAALGRGGESQPNAPPFNQYVAGVASAPNSSSSSKSLTTLTAMGFSQREASAALHRANGDLETAINFLSSSS